MCVHACMCLCVCGGGGGGGGEGEGEGGGGGGASYYSEGASVAEQAHCSLQACRKTSPQQNRLISGLPAAYTPSSKRTRKKMVLETPAVKH